MKIKDFTWMFITPIFIMFLGIVSQFFLARYLTKEQFGQFYLLISWISILNIFAFNSFNSAVIKATSQKNKSFFKVASKICLILSFIGSLVLITVGLFTGGEIKLLYFLTAIFFPFYAGINIAPSFFIGSKKFGLFSFISIFTSIIVLISQIIVLMFVPKVFYLLLITLSITSLINIILTTYLFKKIKVNNDKENKNLVKYSIHISLINIIPTISNKIQDILLGFLAGTSILAISAVAQIFPEKITNLIRSTINPFSVFLSSQKKDNAIKILRKSVFIIFILGIILTFFLELTLPTLINFIFGTKYQDSINYSLILILTIPFMPLEYITNSFLFNHGFKKEYFYATNLKGIFRIVLLIILVPLFMIWGVIIAIVITSFVQFVFYLYLIFNIPFYNEDKYTLLMRGDKKFKYKGDVNYVYIDDKINEKNFLNVLKSDYIKKDSKYPIWARIIFKLTIKEYI